MSIRGLAYSLFVCTGILKMAAFLVPVNARGEWLEEWRAELWHVWHICNQNHGSAAVHCKEESIAFALGAFKDALWLRRNHSCSMPRQGFRAGTPSRCIFALGIVAAGSLLFAYYRPSVWNVMRPNSYHDAKDLVMISRSGFETAPYPTVQISEYEAWRRSGKNLFRGLAFYQLAGKQLTLGTGSSPALPVARASSNLFELLGVPVSFQVAGVAAGHQSGIFLSRSAWRRYFHSDSHIFGRTLQVDGQQALIAGVIQDEDWRLPGQTEVWLLEDDHHLSALHSDTEGYVLAHAEPSVFRPEPNGRRQMFVRKDEGYDWFVCESLAERIRLPLSNFLFALVLACLALPATTSLPLGEYPAHSNQVPWSTRIRRWAFLSVKFTLIVAVAYCGSLDLAYSSSSMPVGTSELLELLGSFWGLLFGFRWALRDQRKRCPVCLRTLTSPARVGQFSRNFLAWNGTELICLSGHGLLHVPDIPTSWFSSQRWLYLDPSWKGLFSGGYLTSAGMF
jgi:hypothetical protein